MNHKRNAQALRKNMTRAEQLLWKHLRLNQLKGVKFRRQSLIGSYVVDFVCFEKKVIVEIDGGQHMEQAEYDFNRTKWLESQGFCVLRFWNNEIFAQLDGVLESISNKLTPHLNPPPQGGRKNRSKVF